ncbi:hypothetical protein HDE69_004379 [Pedobacter cryoconitis]|uniref:Uncharacterized protein n=1 Tax=Pedobacter cryoconitis TaxID=188932 RepID=A0A7W8YXE0_9SPHI|nr:hypothetical protein [Pedobacter cryoconitis]MBB5623295.1 hypothetical protein [Pedobacter cryoconitis]MBB5646732.1 hypothetical protein [Pedobacter cryoconitis]
MNRLKPVGNVSTSLYVYRMEVKLDKTTLPQHGQQVLFQTVIDEEYETWQEGIYNAKAEYIKISKGDIYDMWGDVVRWEPSV